VTLDDVRQNFLELEQSLLHPDVRKDRTQLQDLLAADFVEIASSGRVYDRQSVIEALLTEESVRRIMTDFNVKLLGESAALVTYQSAQISAAGKTHRAAFRLSLWQFDNGRWRMTFHQGTLKS
jgi:hypothetical protein